MFALANIPLFSHTGYPFGGVPLFSLGPITGSLNLVANTGAAFSLLSGHSTLLFVIRMLLIAGLVTYLCVTKEHRFSWWLVVVGALGNVLDFCVYGYVVDFLHVAFWGKSFPIFNLADCWITFGVMGLLWTSRNKKRILSV